MFVIVKCPRCGYRSWLDAAAVDRRVRCRKCRRLVKGPDANEVSKAVSIISEAKSSIFVDDAGRTYG